MPGRPSRFTALRAWLAALAVAASLGLQACTGPGLEPPNSSDDRGGGVVNPPSGPAASGAGASGTGASGTTGGGGGGVPATGGVGGAGGLGSAGDHSELIDAGVDAGDGGLDEDAGALR